MPCDMYQSLHDSIYTCIKSIYRAIYVILKDQMQVDIKTNANKKWYKKKIEIGLILSQGASDNTSWHETTSRSMVFSQIKKNKQTRNDINKFRDWITLYKRYHMQADVYRTLVFYHFPVIVVCQMKHNVSKKKYNRCDEIYKYTPIAQCTTMCFQYFLVIC